MSDSYIFRKKPGIVYIVGNKEHGLYKIGSTTRTLEIRIAEFAPRLPFNINIFAAIASKDAPALEDTLHRIFRANKFRDDWHVFSEKELDEVIKTGEALNENRRIHHCSRLGSAKVHSNRRAYIWKDS